MIEFKCEHCDKGLRLSDSYAGRDGWCRSCKRMIIVPSNGQSSQVADLPKQEGFERLQRLLQYAATKADKFKMHLAQQGEEDSRLATVEDELLQLREEMAEGERVLASLRDSESAIKQTLDQERQAHAERIDSLECALKAAQTASDQQSEGARSDLENALDDANRELARLQTYVDEKDSRLNTLEGELAQLTATGTNEITRLQEQCANLREALEAEENAARELGDENTRLAALLEQQASGDSDGEGGERLHALEANLGQVQEKLAKAEGERLEIASSFSELQQRAAAQARTIATQEAELKERSDSFESLQVRHDERERNNREQLYALEEQVSLFTELKERVASLQEKVSGLDRERLNLTLSLEELNQQHEIEKKKAATLESRLQNTTTEKAGHLVQLEDLQRESHCKEEQVKKLSAELRTLADAQSASDLAREKEARVAHAAGERASLLAEELATLRREQEEKAALQAELERQLSEAQSEREALNAQLEAAGSHTRDGSAALTAVQERVSVLELELEDRREAATRHLAKEAELARELEEARGKVAVLEGRLIDAETLVTMTPKLSDSADMDDDDDYSDDDDGETIVVTETVSDRQRHSERKQMMDVLSDFLDK